MQHDSAIVVTIRYRGTASENFVNCSPKRSLTRLFARRRRLRLRPIFMHTLFVSRRFGNRVDKRRYQREILKYRV